MARKIATVASVLFVALAALWGCGRDQVGECNTNVDCSGEQVCLRGTCVDQPGPDTGTDGGDTEAPDTEMPDVQPDVPGGCYEMNGMCVQQDCSGGECQTVGCPPGCEDWEAASGCDCEAKSCRPGEGECGLYACLGGTCGKCSTDEECGEDETCSPNGKCLEGKLCEDDADCPARKRCNTEGQCVERAECVLDDDCGDQEICFNGRCTYSPECESDSDCREGQECIGEQCYDAVCRGHSDCEGDKLCDAGECVDPPSVARCFVATPDQKIADNERVKLEALAVDSNGNGVSATFQWSSSDSNVASIDSNGNFAVGGNKAGTTTITARTAGVDSVKCQDPVELTNLGQVSQKKLRVVVTDARSGAPVPGATVRLGKGANAQTNGAGVAELPRPNGKYSVSVFHSDYNYLTVQGVRSPDIRIPLIEKKGDGPVAGFQGQFKLGQIHTQGDITLGLAGSGVTGGMLELGLGQLLGQPLNRQVQTPMGNADVPLPAGLVAYGSVFGFNLDIKKDYYATSPDGARLGWGLAGKVPGQKLIQLFTSGGNTLAQLLPLFNRFDHSVRPLQLMDRPRVQDTGDFDGDGDTSEMLPDYQNFPSVGLQPSVRQNLVTQVSISNFPKLKDGRAELAVLVGGNMLQSPGFVPLGISATSDEDDDGYPDLRNLSMAPPHGPLAGGRFGVVALAIRGEGFSPQNGLEMPDNFSAALWSKQTLPKQVSLGTFPNASEGTVDVMNRTVDLTKADAGPIYRVKLVGSERTWEVWSMGPQGSMGTYSHTIDIPKATGGRTDLLVQGSVVVDAVQVSVGIDQLVKATGIGLRDIGLVATAFNRTKLK